jgi:hypothetical protein
MRDREDDDAAQKNHWSECGRATWLYNAGAPGRPHRSVLSLGSSEWTRIEEINEIDIFINFGNHTSRGKMDI